MDEFGKHAIRAALLYLANAAKNRKFIVCHTHVCLHIKSEALLFASNKSRTSSAWTYVSVIGSNSAVGIAVKKLEILVNNRRGVLNRSYLSKIGRSKASRAYAINLFKSVLLIPPMGLISAATIGEII